MLGIKDGTGRWKTWYVNERPPEIEGQVITFQADGHELDLILIALNMNYTYDGQLIPFKKGE